MNGSGGRRERNGVPLICFMRCLPLPLVEDCDIIVVFERPGVTPLRHQVPFHCCVGPIGFSCRYSYETQRHRDVTRVTGIGTAFPFMKSCLKGENVLHCHHLRRRFGVRQTSSQTNRNTYTRTGSSPKSDSHRELFCSFAGP